jgi:hypothetical protein
MVGDNPVADIAGGRAGALRTISIDRELTACRRARWGSLIMFGQVTPRLARGLTIL